MAYITMYNAANHRLGAVVIVQLFTKVYPLGRSSQALAPWEERPRLSGFSPLCCQISRSMVQLFVYEGTIRGLHPWTRFLARYELNIGGSSGKLPARLSITAREWLSVILDESG